MKRILLYAGVIAASAALLVLCFLSPFLLEKRFIREEKEIRLLEASPAGTPADAPASPDILSELSLLAGQENLLSSTEFEDGTVFSREKAVSHAWELLGSFASGSAFSLTQETLETGPEHVADTHVFFYLYEKEHLPHSAFIWFCRFTLADKEDATVAFDDATGRLLQISLPVYEEFGFTEFIAPKKNPELRLASARAADVFGSFAGLTVTDLQFAEPRSVVSGQDPDLLRTEQDFTFRLASGNSRSETVSGRWVLLDGKKNRSLRLSLSPGGFPADDSTESLPFPLEP